MATRSAPTTGRTKKKAPDGPAPRAPLTYAKSGVSIEEGDRFVDMIRRDVRRTHGPRVLDRPGGFAGLFRLDFNEKLFKRNYREPVLVACTDGVGTKVKIASDTGRYDTIGIDLVAMNVNDLIVEGAEPLFFLDYIAAHKIIPEQLAAVVKGISDGCRQAGAALIGGETAEMPGVYPEGEIDLAGFAVGVVELERATSRERVEPGDVVIGLESDGVHSNGYSLVRAVVKEAGLHLDKVYKDLDKSRTLGEVLLTPTRIYAKPIVALQRAYTVKKIVSGMAHITGSGLGDNLERALHPKVDAILDPSKWPVTPVFTFLQQHGSIDEDEMRRVFNMGIGYCLVVRPTFAASIATRLKRAGERPHLIGHIVKGSGKVRMTDRE
ncbi:MAG: phosphoribosylformylglycinamidine cyclo-ligase [Phycisphaerales bacterium]|nr:phosphoribosylformylglycinamidine cyclo-ligase [Phycisphaerales bacterium]